MRGVKGARRWFAAGLLAGLGVGMGGCRDRAAPPAEEAVRVDSIPRTVDLRLYVARDWTWNEQDTLRVTVVNATEQPVSGALELFVAAPVELLRHSAAARGDSAAPRLQPSADGTRAVFAVRELAPGASAEFRQAVRTPPAPPAPAAAGTAPRDTTPRFAVRATLTGSGGARTAAAADTIRIRAGSDVVRGGCGGVGDVALTRYGVGPLRLDMRAADVRSLCPEARDTTWQGQEGMTERGLRVRLAGNPVLVLLQGETVRRIVVDSAGLRTGAGVGVGSTVADLRGRYGRLCAGQGEGRVAVWTPAAPGISFGLDSTVVAGAPPVEPAALPDTARVDQVWVRQGNDDCARGEGS